MKTLRILALCLVASLWSCSSSDEQWTPWTGDSMMPEEGGTVVWRPAIDGLNLFPVIEAVSLSFFNSEGERFDTTQVDMASQKRRGATYEKVEGEWYEVVASRNALTITLAPNETPHTRVIEVIFEGGDNQGEHTATVFQPYK